MTAGTTGGTTGTTAGTTATVRLGRLEVQITGSRVTLAGRMDETSRLEGDLLDLEPLLRDAVVLALPFQPLCQDDCPGLCVECGARLADDPDHGHETQIDPRWAALQGLAQDEQDREKQQ